jgi:hypothetical protein
MRWIGPLSISNRSASLSGACAARCLVVLLVIGSGALYAKATPSLPPLEQQFKNPPDRYKPMPFWHINGELTTEGIRRQMRDARERAGFTGVSVLPLTGGGRKPGTLPEFLSEAYFDRFEDVLASAKELDMQVILYDDIGFPSGMAGGKMERLYPEHTRKRLDKVEKLVKWRMRYRDILPGGVLMSAVAMHTETLERVDLRPFIKGRRLEWQVPNGTWKIMYFMLVQEGTHKKYLMTDYLDPTAVEHLLSLTYDEYARRFGGSFGQTIQTVFFDDIGFWKYPRTWTAAFNDTFEALQGFDPAPFYPALWYDIGPDTAAVRHAFFKTRAELLAEGFPRLVGAWARKHGLTDTGHPPGNYDPTPIDMNGDIFKFYRHTAMPLTDYIIRYGFGQDGHKLISSAADYYDRPVVATEIYGAFRENTFDKAMLYRAMMDLFTRGVNFVIPHGMWYDSEPGKIGIPPLVSPYSDKIAAELPAYSEFVGRSCLLLQGGRRVADMGVLYPFEELAGWYRFEDPNNPRQGFFVSPETDYLQISDLLTKELRRDFTFIHPEFFLEDRYTLQGGAVHLNNTENSQTYRALVLTGCHIISHKTLAKVKAFNEQGGLVVATTQLPFKSAEIGEDQRVLDLVQGLFGIDPLDKKLQQDKHVHLNKKGGVAVFVPKPDRANLTEVFDEHMPLADVAFVPAPELPAGPSHLSYIHKIKDGRDIFYFANSSDMAIETDILIRGHRNLEAWNPHTGTIDPRIKGEHVKRHGEDVTRFPLTLRPVTSLFLVGCDP